MSLIRRLARAALHRLDDDRPQQQKTALMLPPPRAELGFPYVQQVYGQPIGRSHPLMPTQDAPPPIAWEPAPPPAPIRRRRRVVITEEIYIERY